MSPTRKSFRFVSFVRACLRAVWFPSGIRTQKVAPMFSLLPFEPGSFPLPLPSPPQTSYPTLVGLSGISISIIRISFVLNCFKGF